MPSCRAASMSSTTRLSRCIGPPFGFYGAPKRIALGSQGFEERVSLLPVSSAERICLYVTNKIELATNDTHETEGPARCYLGSAARIRTGAGRPFGAGFGTQGGAPATNRR